MSAHFEPKSAAAPGAIFLIIHDDERPAHDYIGCTPKIVKSAASLSKTETAARRDEILEAVTVVFGKHGYDKGSLAVIGVRVGITRAGVLHHFGFKEDLRTAVLAYRGFHGVALKTTN